MLAVLADSACNVPWRPTTHSESSPKQCKAVALSKEATRRREAIEQTIVHPGADAPRLKDIVGMEDVKHTLAEAIILPTTMPHLFTGARRPWSRVLMFGPPGTGKTALARAVAAELSGPFYYVSSADLISSWVGESEKLVRDLFKHAQRQERQAVIFIDEIDSLCRSRSAQEASHSRRVKTELLRQMEMNASDSGRGSTNAKVLLLCATNSPYELDSAFIRRFQKRIFVGPPTVEARAQLIAQAVNGNGVVVLDESAVSALAIATETYSGSDICMVVRDALLEPVREVTQTRTWFAVREGDDGHTTGWQPCPPSAAGAVTMDHTDIPAAEIRVRPVCYKDFQRAITRNPSTIHTDELKRLTQFAERFGAG
eukprot:UC1_evm2s1234